MNTNTLSKMMALALLCAGAVLVPANADAAYQTALYTSTSPTTRLNVPTGTRVATSVQLRYYARGSWSNPLSKRNLSVVLEVGGGTVPPVSTTIAGIRTDNNGNVIVTFTMPPKRRNASNTEISTWVRLHLRYPGEANYNPAHTELYFTVK